MAQIDYADTIRKLNNYFRKHPAMIDDEELPFNEEEKDQILRFITKRYSNFSSYVDPTGLHRSGMFPWKDHHIKFEMREEKVGKQVLLCLYVYCIK